MRCPDYDCPTKITDETADEYLCEYCGMRGVTCDGRGNIQEDKIGESLAWISFGRKGHKAER